MKNLLLIGIMLIGVLAFSQRTLTDTIQGAETVNFTSMQGAKYIQVLCEDDFGGTSDGLLMLQGSVDGVSWDDLFTNDNYWYSSIDSDSLTIAPDATWVINAGNLNFPYYRLTGDGTSGDTTLVTIKWSK